ncbi:MAG: ferrous iron transport protein A [Lachnospiraceae bacterium]|nr:ferrous iron transport protein A [Lachnospiraceae bacterium]
MPLSLAALNKLYYIQRIAGTDETRCYLASLGFIPGAEISIISAFSGNFIIKILGSSIAIDKALAKKIIITDLKVT